MDNSFAEGRILLIDKPKNWTSFDVVKKIRYAIKIKKIGHAGTLDPLATGLLILGTGKYTKKLNELQGLDKVYEGIFEIGKTTPSYDLETPFDTENAWSHIEENDLLSARNQLLGEIEQIPPSHSAVKVDGQRAYKKARQNKEVIIEPRRVHVKQFEIDYTNLPEVSFKITCTKGTYIRSVAHDFGKILGVGAYLKKLVRTQVGDYSLDHAQKLETFLSQLDENS